MNATPTSQPANAESARNTKNYHAKDFAKRLDTAVHGHPHAPPGHGRQKWLRDLLSERCGLDVSAEAVRKWFAGESRPRHVVMKQIAQALEVDEAWFSLGITPTETPTQAKKRRVVAEGAVNLVAGLIQLSGYQVAYSEGRDRGVDLHAIIDGRKIDIEVKSVTTKAQDRMVFALSRSEADVAIGVIPNEKGLGAKLIWLTRDLIEETGQQKGGFTEIAVEQSGSGYRTGEKSVPQLNSFKTLAERV